MIMKYDYYPYTIRRKSNNKIVKGCINKQSGYIRITLNDKTFQMTAFDNKYLSKLTKKNILKLPCFENKQERFQTIK